MRTTVPKHELLSTPVQPFEPAGVRGFSDLLERMSRTAFQGRQLGEAFLVWKKMLAADCIILMGLAGAMVPAGMRRLVAEMIRRRLIDCLVSTGANLFHDLHETLGHHHYQGSPHVDDVALAENMVDRMYDVFADEDEFRAHDRFLGDFAAGLDPSRPYTTREFLYLLGRRLAEMAREEGILTAAARASVPVYCPALGDSSIGIGIAAHRHTHGNRLLFDIVGDVLETAYLANSGPTGVIYFGGGTPKNFIQQTEVTLLNMSEKAEGHKYALQVVTDAPHWGGLSGCTFQEAQSWGKVAPDAHMVTCHCDATIAMPLLVAALLEHEDLIARRRPPRFDVSGPKLGIELPWQARG